jgi:murein DD-endopeptidase MepM/ murein hydrolase activator NlpD
LKWFAVKRSDVGVLVVRGDGRLIRRVSLPRRLRTVLTAIGVIGAIASAAATVHYAGVYRERTALAATNDMLTRSASELPTLRQRLVEVRDEMRAWDQLHTEVWKPLGGAARANVGMGGATSRASAHGTALDEIDTLLAQVREESRRLRALAHATRETGPILAALPSKLPQTGTLNSPFGPRVSPWTGETEFHAGIDFAAAPGTPVKASSAGVVRSAGSTPMYGHNVLIDHGVGVQSRYAHLQTTSVTAGQRVERGEVIGLSGNTGRSTGPHLHYEVLVNGRAVDPRRLVRN